MRKCIDENSLPPAIEGVLIRRRAVAAARYASRLEAQAKRASKKIVAEATQKQEALFEQAKAQGYQLGFNLLIQQVITTLDDYHHTYNNMLKVAKTTLIDQLEQLFSSEVLLRSLVEELAAQYAVEPQVSLFLPKKFATTLNDTLSTLKSNMQVIWTDISTISIEIGDKVLTFNAENYSKNRFTAANHALHHSSHYALFSTLQKEALQQAKQQLEEHLLRLVSPDNDPESP